MAQPSSPSLRVIAIFLALGGLFWGVMLLMSLGWKALYPLPFGVGYLVTLGYLIRATMRPPIALSVAIWCVSIFVQGIWLIFGLLDGFNVLVLWWATATLASIAALKMELDDLTTEE